MGRDESTIGPARVLWRLLVVLVWVESFMVHCQTTVEEPKRITYCGRAVSISDELSPKVLLNSSADPAGCITNPERYRVEGESYTKCSVNEIVLRDGESAPLFGVEIGNVTGQVSAFLEPDRVRGICMRSDLTDSTTEPDGETGGAPPAIVCFHRLEPAAKFLARTCTSRGCRNHFFLAAIGACGEPEVLEENELSFAVAGIPMGWKGSILQSSKIPTAPSPNRGRPINATMTYCSRIISVPKAIDPYTLLSSTPALDPIRCSEFPGRGKSPETGVYTPCLTGTAALSSISSTPLYRIVLGQIEVLILAGLPLDGTMDKGTEFFGLMDGVGIGRTFTSVALYKERNQIVKLVMIETLDTTKLAIVHINL
ncbi:hypothetical protein BSKO_13813 [Bryopsis sp. KO-2023]|nr:hypothetical protein BSKO_13813 [Bryopsis sp. KO-2023]